MKYDISEKGPEIRIRFKGIAERLKNLTEIFRDCQNGLCVCPDSQCENLETIDIEPGDDELNLRFIPKSGRCFNKTEIEKCMLKVVERLSAGE